MHAVLNSRAKKSHLKHSSLVPEELSDPDADV